MKLMRIKDEIIGLDNIMNISFDKYEVGYFTGDTMYKYKLIITYITNSNILIPVKDESEFEELSKQIMDAANSNEDVDKYKERIEDIDSSFRDLHKLMFELNVNDPMLRGLD